MQLSPKPVVKWCGGKRSSLPLLMKHVPAKVGTYFEPFAGGAAMFFAMAAAGRFKNAWLNDINEELMLTYKAVRDHSEELIFQLRGMKNKKKIFLTWREQPVHMLSPVERAARFIYLNKTCFNGLYRVNARGKFNVPFGDYPNPTICDEDNLRACSQVLQYVDLTGSGYYAAVQSARRGDLVYFDPPYLPKSDTANFTGFTPGGWKDEDHEKLASRFEVLSNRGVSVMLSNADVPRARKLYKGYEIVKTKVRRNVNSDGTKRGPVGEILVLANCAEKTNHVAAV